MKTKPHSKKQETHPVLEIAQTHKGAIITLLISVLINVSFYLAPLFDFYGLSIETYLPMTNAISVLVAICLIYFNIKLASMVSKKYIALWAICAFLPFINLFSLGILSSKTVKELRQQGFKVGFWGANIGMMKQALSNT